MGKEIQMLLEIKNVNVLLNLDEIDFRTNIRLIEIASKAQLSGANLDYTDIYKMVDYGLNVQVVDRYKCVTLLDLLKYKARKEEETDEALLDWIYYARQCLDHIKSKEIHLKGGIKYQLLRAFIFNDPIVNRFLLRFAKDHNYNPKKHIDLLVGQRKKEEAISLFAIFNLVSQYQDEMQKKNKPFDQFWQKIIFDNVSKIQKVRIGNEKE